MPTVNKSSPLVTRKRLSLGARLKQTLQKRTPLVVTPPPKRGTIVNIRGGDRYGRFVDGNPLKGWARVSLPGGGNPHNLIIRWSEFHVLPDQRKAVRLLPKGFNLTPLKGRG